MQAVSISIGNIKCDLNDPNTSNKLADDIIDWDKKLTAFQRCLLIRIFAPEKLLAALTIYVEETIGREYVLPPPSSIPDLYNDINKNVPLIFILSPGSDPMTQFQKFAAEKGYASRYHVISLGQGQGVIAERMIEAGVKSGDWIFLQNCHLAKSWMPSMESIIKSFTDTTVKRAPNHPDFRLWLSSMPTQFFPVSVLQGSVKVTNEPPAGLRANLKRSIESLEPDYYEKHQIGQDWRKSVMGVCFFHAIIQERKRFGALGWNIPYEFNDTDRDCCLANFELWSKEGSIQWDALLYITGWVTYGGRVTDEWDQRTLNCILKKFIGIPTLEIGYAYTQDNIYRAPGETDTVEQLKAYIDGLPNEDAPEVFGMNSNAQLAAQKKEMNSLIDTLAMVAPKSAGGGGATDQFVNDLGDQIKSKLMAKIYSENPCEALFIPDKEGRQNSLSTVLMQEIERFNKLLNVIFKSLTELKKAIAGTVVMSEEIEAIYNAFLMNQVPAMWANAAYPSPKSLISWVMDLNGRCLFFERWLTKGIPLSYRLSYFFFPQGFMTGTLQNYSRQQMIAIDQLSFKFEVLPITQWPDVTNPENDEYEDSLPKQELGVLVYGVYCDAFRWDIDSMKMADERPKITCEQMPMMRMVQMNNWEPPVEDYKCPLYKTPTRAGTLSTTGHSTNFICPVNLVTDEHTDKWIRRGTALISQTID